MRHLENLQMESKELEVFEIERLIQEFLADKGIKANVQKFDSVFKVYISSYAKDDEKKSIPVKKLADHVRGLDVVEDVEVYQTKYGYDVVLLNDDNSAHLRETFEPEEDEGHVCSICEGTYHGLGHDPWPVYTKPEERVCNECMRQYIIPERKDFLKEHIETKTEADKPSKKGIKHAASNVVLDSKYVWLFNVLDEHGDDIEEGIEYLQDAIDVLVDNNGTYLIGFPYVDPKPEDDSVELVFADNPGPVIIYNREEATAPKNNEYSSDEETEQLESVQEEASKIKGLDTAHKDLQLIRRALLTANEHLMFSDWSDITKAWLNINNIVSRLKMQSDNKEEAKESIQEAARFSRVGIQFKRGYFREITQSSGSTSVTELERHVRKTLDNHIDTVEKEVQESIEVILDLTEMQDDFYASNRLQEENAIKAKEVIEEESLLAPFVNDGMVEVSVYSDKQPWEESVGSDDYTVLLEFTKQFYLDHEDHSIEVSEVLDAFVTQMEEYLAEVHGVYVDFEYDGTDADYFTSPLSWEEAERAEKAIERYTGDWALTQIKDRNEV